ncbi:flagellar hook-length control protein FliK [Campylobacter sp. CCUG 57310]|uniref:flagellar hook-length control protein FliK n=1 Tax=Campylobacter sp. CCUG 57310 TaxID=2517362 RepID=UPI00156372E6|nr:flagellar hook-length control protein FliK [Campylobacter sp. CCUG 57310]QKF93157.1 flagellar hook-length control protein FliK [Campylobacter sp. CCUG 57310]
MQTSQSKILSFDASIAGGIKQPNTNSSSEENGEFLSLVLEAAAGKGENLDEKDIKNIVNSVNMSAQKRAQSEQKSEDINVKEILGDEEASKLFTNVTFMQLLQILEMLNGGEKISKFPNFTAPLTKALSNEATIHELKSAKNIHELIVIAKRLNLGLEKITISKEQASELSAKFPNLGQKEFFLPVKPAEIYSMELKAKVEEALQLSKDDAQPVKLNKLLQEISKEIANEARANLSSNLVDKQTPKVENLKSAQVQISNEITKENISQTIQKESIKADEKSLNTSKVNLQSLLYPQREQSETSGEQSSPNSESELNSMVREIMQNARSQSKNLQLVRQTFDNFNTTLKEQVEAYKSPFMRFNITLNPLNLGEVEITMVNRGNNLHINFNSTTQTMNLFLQNQAEFKASLVNMGFTELEMNFSDQNQRKDQGGKAYKGSKLTENEGMEIAESPMLEIVLPKYI